MCELVSNIIIELKSVVEKFGVGKFTIRHIILEKL